MLKTKPIHKGQTLTYDISAQLRVFRVTQHQPGTRLNTNHKLHGSIFLLKVNTYSGKDSKTHGLEILRLNINFLPMQYFFLPCKRLHPFRRLQNVDIPVGVLLKINIH
jgi:hypothetical protein